MYYDNVNYVESVEKKITRYKIDQKCKVKKKSQRYILEVKASLEKGFRMYQDS